MPIWPARSKVAPAAPASSPILGHAELFAPPATRSAPEREPADVAAHAAGLREAGAYAAADELLQTELARQPGSVPLLIEHATNATATGRFLLAVGRWEAVRAQAPAAAIGYTQGANALGRLGAHEEAASLVQAGLARLPEDRALLAACARHACRKQNWAEAELLWTRALTLYPDDAPLVLDAARSMFGRRFDRATRLPFILHHLARAQMRFHGDPGAFALHIEVLRESRQLDEAAAFGARCRARFPADEALAVACANLEGERGHPGHGVELLASFAAGAAPLEAARVRLLCLAGDLAAAEAACEAAIARHDADVALIEQHIAIATRRGDFEAAARRCAQWQARLPNDAAVLAIARRISLLTEESGPKDAPPAEGAARLFARCEGLGATRFGCEFGMVQRHFGADPIGLLRWSNISLDGLARGLRQGFAGLDDPARTVLETRAANHGEREYYLVNAEYGYFAHTFIRTSEAPAGRVYSQALRRLGFLAAKLMEDVTAAEKVFVFKAPDYAGPGGLRDVVAALRARGPCTLLCVALGDADHPGGSVQAIAPGLIIGRVCMFTDAGTTAGRGVDLDGWRRICAAAVEMSLETPRHAT